MHRQFFFGEHRLLNAFKEVGPNVKEWAADVNDHYLTGPWERKDPIQIATGPLMAGASALFEGTDQIWSGMVDQKLERPHGMLGRFRRDTRLFLKNVFTLHPLRAIGDGFRLVLADPILDGGDLLGGFRNDEVSRAQMKARGEVHHALAA
jgi:hypothetical protein